MADVKKMATRDGYGKALVELGKEHDDIVVLDADLAGSTKTGMFAKAYPDRHFNCGIAEGNMMSVAAGLAAAGLTPFASSFAMFASGRAYEQIRKALLEQVVVGVTLLNVETGYDGLDQKAVLSVVYARKYPEIRETALSIDPKAFIVTSDVTNVNGKGYTLHRYDGTPL